MFGWHRCEERIPIIFICYFRAVEGMRIYVAHKQGADFQDELYAKLRQSALNTEHTIILPHEQIGVSFDSKQLLHQGVDVMIAEVTFHAIGVGMEIAYADVFGVPLLCVYRNGSKPSNSALQKAKKVIEYETIEGLISDIEKLLPEFQ